MKAEYSNLKFRGRSGQYVVVLQIWRIKTLYANIKKIEKNNIIKNNVTVNNFSTAHISVSFVFW